MIPLCNPDRGPPGPVYSNELSRILSSTTLKFVVLRSHRTVPPSDQKPSGRINYQQILSIWFLQAHRCRHPSYPCAQKCPIATIYQFFRILHVVNQKRPRQLVSHNFLLSFFSIPIRNGRGESRIQTPTVRTHFYSRFRRESLMHPCQKSM